MGQSISGCSRGSCKDGCFGCICLCGGVSRGDLHVSGFRGGADLQPLVRVLLSAANGDYLISGENHGVPVYRHVTRPFFVYYWDGRDGPLWSGWWLGPAVGSATVCAYAGGVAGSAPPESGWKVPWNGPVHPRMRVRLSRMPKILRLGRKYQLLQEISPRWLLEPGLPTVPAVFPEDQCTLESCCICLQPLWNAKPSVFLVNSQRLCPHYFCQDCAQRVISEATSLVRILQEDMKLALVDSLATVLDADGEPVGDLVWKQSGVRISDGEFAVILDQLRRMSELQAGMELRFEEGQVAVWKDGVAFGRLLRVTSGRSLQLPSQDDLRADCLNAVVTPSDAGAIRGRYTVLCEREGNWKCDLCFLDNPTSKLRCGLCRSPPPRPSTLPEIGQGHVLMSADLAALRRRFAIRPRINWAVQLQCPLCRSHGVASLLPLPQLATKPHAWFRLVDVDGNGHISPSTLAHALAAVLPVSYEELCAQLEGRSSGRSWAPKVPSGVSISEFLSEGGVAQWACQHLASIGRPTSAQMSETSS